MIDNQLVQPLSFADLKLVMDNYQNLIQMNAIMLEQQKQVVDLQKDITKKHDDITKTQYQLYTTLEVIADKFETYNKNVTQFNNDAKTTFIQANDSIQGTMQTIDGKIETVHIDNTKEFGKISNKIYVGMIGSAAIIVSLITLLMVVYDKYTIVSDIKEMLVPIFEVIVGG